jgi:hypothetical protein
MWKNSNFTLPSVLIVENESGDVFIVENKSSEPEIEKILKTEKTKNSPGSSKKKTEIKIRPRTPSPVTFK